MLSEAECGATLRCVIKHWGGLSSYQMGSFPREGIPDISINRGTEDTYEILHHRGKCVKQKEKISDPLVC